MSLRQQNATCRDTVHDKTLSQLLCSLLAASVLIDIEGEIDDALAFTELAELGVIQMRAQRAGHIRKAGLTQHRIVEQPFNQDHLGAVANLIHAYGHPCSRAGSDGRTQSRCCGRRG